MLTDEEKLEIEKGVVARILEHYHVIYQAISLPENIIPKVDLDMAIESLGEEESLVIKSIFIHGYTEFETAEMVGTSRGSVNRIRNKALEKIAKKCMEV